MEPLRDPIWQLVGALIALTGIALTIILYRFQRRKKELSYNVLTKTSILTVRREIKDDIQVFHKNTPVDNIQILIIKIANSGTIPITSHDFEQPLKIGMGETKILSADVMELTPNSLQPILNHTESEAIIEPLLLNPGDSLTVKFITTRTSQSSDRPLLTGRIVGVKRIFEQRYEINPPNMSIMGFLFFVIFLLAALLSFLYGIMRIYPLNPLSLFEEVIIQEIGSPDVYHWMISYYLFISSISFGILGLILGYVSKEIEVFYEDKFKPLFNRTGRTDSSGWGW